MWQDIECNGNDDSSEKKNIKLEISLHFCGWVNEMTCGCTWDD